MLSASAIAHHPICGPTWFAALALDLARKRAPCGSEAGQNRDRQQRRNPCEPRDSRGLVPESIDWKLPLAANLNSEPWLRPNSAAERQDAERSKHIDCEIDLHFSPSVMQILGPGVLERHSELAAAEFSRAHLIAPSKFQGAT